MKIKFIENTQENNFHKLSNIAMKMVKGGVMDCSEYKGSCDGFDSNCGSYTGTCTKFNGGCNTFNSK